MNMVKILLIILTLCIKLFAEFDTDTLYCHTKLTPFDGGNYYGYYNSNQQECGGDLNGDGVNDIVLAGKKEGEMNGEIHIHFGGNQIDSIPDFIIKGDQLGISNYNFGTRFVYDGDLNSDGFDDLVVSASGKFNSPTTGHIFIFKGGEEFDIEPDYVLYGNDYSNDSEGLNFGAWLDIKGDINGDGVNDLIVHSMGPSYYWNGQVDLFFGGENFDTQSDWMIKGENGIILGQIVTHGDLNGDGFDEIICTHNTENFTYGRKIKVYLGGEVPSFNSIWDFKFDDIEFNHNLPFLKSGCDLNYDGYEDLVLAYNTYGGIEGAVNKIFFGDPDSFLDDSGLNTTFENDIYSSLILLDCNGDSRTDILEVILYQNDDNLWAHYIRLRYGGPDISNSVDLNLYIEDEDEIIMSVNYLGDIIGDSSTSLLLITRDNDWNWTAGIYTFKSNSIISESAKLNNDFYLSQNYPNPFNPVTTIDFTLPQLSDLKLSIYNVKGEHISTLVDSHFNKGRHSIQFDGSSYSSGLYYYRLKVGDKLLTNKMMLLK